MLSCDGEIDGWSRRAKRILMLRFFQKKILHPVHSREKLAFECTDFFSSTILNPSKMKNLR